MVVFYSYIQFIIYFNLYNNHKSDIYFSLKNRTINDTGLHNFSHTNAVKIILRKSRCSNTNASNDLVKNVMRGRPLLT